MPGFALALCLAAAQTAVAQAGMLQPSKAADTVAASGGSITVSVTRVAGSTGAVGCSYATVNGTAVAGVDFVAQSGTLSWADGDSAAKNVVLTILNDGIVSGDKTFALQLSAPTGGASLGVAPGSPLRNQEGRVLGGPATITAPVDWDTATADGILQTLQILPANNPWNEDITGLPVSPESAGIVAFMGSASNIHVNRDMNLSIVPGNQATKSAHLTLYGTESDPGPYPIPDNLPIEGFLGDDPRTLLSDIQQDINPGPLGGDRHATILDPQNGYLYEFGNMVRDSSDAWTASGEATFNMNSNTTRQAGWTSTDAAGLPILPAITRYDECQRGMVEHAIRVTAVESRDSYVWPATHKTGSQTATNRPRMGERFRLRESASVNAKISAMNPHPKAIALAMKKYGMFMADNGSNWFISTNSDPRLLNLNDLQTLVGSDFDVVVTTGPAQGPRATSTIAITVTDGGGGGGGDTIPPTLSVSVPTTATAYTTTSSLLTVGGSASDNVSVSSVTWTNSAGGSGTATGTTSWTCMIPLAAGTNVLILTAQDGGGNRASAVLTVSSTPSASGSPATGGGGGGGGGGGCGFCGLELLPLFLLRRFRPRC